MSTIVLCCTGLQNALQAAQETMGTSLPVKYLDRKYHEDPKDMRREIQKALAEIPPEYDTILIAQGFCGGSWDEVQVDRKVVLPRVDDCVTLQMQTTEEYQPNLKEVGHIYITEPDNEYFSPGRILKRLIAEQGKEQGEITFGIWFDSYHWLDIVDTGLYDCYDEDFVTRMQADADLFHAEIQFVEGGNILLEKLVSGRWDEQFLILQPGEKARHSLYFT